MHSAPSVNYPVGRSAFAGGVAILLVAAGAAACGAWAWQAGAGGRQLLAFALLLACAGFAFATWWRSPVGVLRWDGLGWSWEEGGPPAPGRPELALDLQGRLLLHWRPHAGRSRWLWVERASDTSHWDALRRAVYSRAGADAPSGAEPPSATP